MVGSSLSEYGRRRGWSRRIALVAILSLVLSSLFIPAVSAGEPVEGDVWYVNSETGSDITGDGSMASPFASITSAIATSTMGDEILVATDTTYTATIYPGIRAEGAPMPVMEIFPLQPKTGTRIGTYGDGERPVLDGEWMGQIMFLGGVEGVHIEGLHFTRGSQEGGGAIGIIDSSADIHDCFFDHNVAAYGPAIDMFISDIWIEGCTFTENGGMPDRPDPPAAPPILEGSFQVAEIVEGVSAMYGGAIYAQDTWFMLWDCVIHDNMASFAGGGVYLEDSYGVLIESEVTSNAAVFEPWVEREAPPVVFQPSSGDIPDSLAGTTKPQDHGGTGGGIATVADSVLDVLGSTVHDNWAWMPGGVFVDTSAEYYIYESQVTSNTGTHKGGGVASFPWVDPSLVTDAAAATPDVVARSLPEATRPSGRGDFMPALQMESEGGNYVGRTVFDRNMAPYGSALTSIMDDDLWVENSLFTHNDTSEYDPDAVVSLMFTDAELWNNTFSQNTGLRANIVNYSASLVTLADPSAITDEAPPPSTYDVYVENSVFWDNETFTIFNQTDADTTASNGFVEGYDTEGCWVDDSDSPLGDAMFPPGPSNIATDPLFADPAADDFHLSSISPCIDSALTTMVAPYEDLDGLARPFDGDDDGEAIHDMGAYEFYPVSRLNGDNRYQTAVEISSASFDAADTVIIATGEVFADGLAASGLCGVYGAPLLLTRPDMVPAEVMAEIARLGASEAIIMGGPNAVHPSVATQLGNAGLTVDRIGGTDRYETAVLIAQEILSWWGDGFHGTVFVARGDRFPDALSVSPAAFWLEAPVLLVAPDALPSQTVEVMESVGDASVIIAGGKSAVNTHVAKGISVAAGDATRVSGPDRYETAVALTEFFVSQGWTQWTYTALATGEGFADALTGGVAVGNDRGVMLLTPRGSLHPATEAALAANKAQISRFEILGGGNAITPATMAAATAAVN